MTPMSSHACWSAGGRNAPAVANSRSPPPNCEWTLRNKNRLAGYGSRRPIDRRRANVAVLPCFSTSRSIALQNRSSTCGTRTMLVTRCSRSESKITRGFRLRTYSTSAPTLSA